jgi:type IV pilus assembly protein PilE
MNHLVDTGPTGRLEGVKPPPPSMAGWSLIEIMISLLIAATLATLAYPSFSQAVLKSRRGEAWTGLQQIQLAQARYRIRHDRYGSLEDIGWRAGPQTSNYAFRITHHDSNGYIVSASARSAQAADTPCQHLQIEWRGLDMQQRSGSSMDLRNGEEQNRRCWSP